MMRTNCFDIVPRNDEQEEILQRMLDASASLWNQLNYDRRQQFFSEENIWECEDYYDEYANILGSATTQQIIRANDEAWRSFFETLDGADQIPSPPGYWGNQDDGRDLQTYIRNDCYSVRWGDFSRLEVPIGKTLKKEYGFSPQERLRLPIQGNPHWAGTSSQLFITYDETAESFRARQSITVDETDRLAPKGTESAAIDIGANVLAACTSTAGDRYLYDGQRPFEQFKQMTNRIADAQTKLPEAQDTSKRIQRLYRKRSAQRDHAVNALIRDLIERLHESGVEQVFHGDLNGVLSEYWSAETNLKNHSFWAYRQFIQRLESVCEEYRISVEAVSEAWTSQTCPKCGEKSETHRHRETLSCTCGFEGHADLVASRSILNRAINSSVRPTARPVRFQWDKHQWKSAEAEPMLPNELRTNP
jgi:putative transposase